MITIKRILCSIDYSVYSELALKYAIEFAEKFNAKLYLLHVMDIRVYDVNDADLFNVNAINDEAIISMKEKLLKCIHDDVKDKISVEAIVVQGVPFAEIINTAKEAQIDLIVLGTHGRTGLAHTIMGSVAEKVVRKAPCPVLTVRNPEHKFTLP